MKRRRFSSRRKRRGRAVTLTEPACRAVVFDLDGTLIDSVPDIAAAVNRMLDEIGREPLSAASVERLIGNGSRVLMEGVFAELGVTADDRLLERALQSYLAFYEAAPAVKTKLFPHVRQDLGTLGDCGLRLGICTNKTHRLAQRVLRELRLDRWFEVVLGADAVANRKPHAGHLLAVISAMRLETSEVIYVGDSAVDQQCARDAGVRFCAVNWGIGTADEDAQRIARLADINNLTGSGPR